MVMIRQFANRSWQRAEVTLEAQLFLVMSLTALQRSQKLFNAASSHDATKEEKVKRPSRDHTARQRIHLVSFAPDH